MEYYLVKKKWPYEICKQIDRTRKEKIILSEVTQTQKEKHDKYLLIDGY